MSNECGTTYDMAKKPMSVMINFRVDDKTDRRLTDAAIKRHEWVSEICRRAVQQYLNRIEPKRARSNGRKNG